MQVFQIASFELDDGGVVHNYLNPPEKNSGRNPPNPCENSHFCERNLTKGKYFHNELAISGFHTKQLTCCT